MKQFKLIKFNKECEEILCISDITLSIIEEKSYIEKEIIANIIFESEAIVNVKSFVELQKGDYVIPKEIDWEIRFDQVSKNFVLM